MAGIASDRVMNMRPGFAASLESVIIVLVLRSITDVSRTRSRG